VLPITFKHSGHRQPVHWFFALSRCSAVSGSEKQKHFVTSKVWHRNLLWHLGQIFSSPAVLWLWDGDDTTLPQE
jgi:hypothetical protein